MPLNRSKNPFIFKTQMSLVMLTGLRAKNLMELRDFLEKVPEPCIYYHTHHYLEQHQFLTPEPPNDFAYWVTTVLNEERIGEKLAAIDTVEFDTLDHLRKELVSVLNSFLKKDAPLRECPPGGEFHFLRCVSFNLPTAYAASDLKEFIDCLKKVSIHSLYYHIFEGRLREPLGVNDFSDWLLRSLGEEKLARQIAGLDPYTRTMEGLRAKIVQLVERRIAEVESGGIGTAA